MTPEDQLRLVRERLGLSRVEMAEALGIGSRYLERMEKDGKPVCPRTLFAARHLAVMAWLTETGTQLPDWLAVLMRDEPVPVRTGKST